MTVLVGANPIGQLLGEAVAYCVPRVDANDPRHCLRTLVPPPTLHSSRSELVETTRRERHYKVGNVTPIERRPSLLGGRILVYFPDAELSCGTPESVTNGFFDIHATPAWDTWLALADDATSDLSYRHYLLAFIPAELVEIADLATRVTPEECLRWLDDAKVKARDELRRYL